MDKYKSSNNNKKNHQKKKNQKKPIIRIAEDHHNNNNKVLSNPKWPCVGNCCWFIGCMCITWWVLLFLHNAMPACWLQYVTKAIARPFPDPPGLKLRKEGLKAKHPVVFLPGIGSAGVELWEGRQCVEGLFKKRLWGGTFGEVYETVIKRY